MGKKIHKFNRRKIYKMLFSIIRLILIIGLSFIVLYPLIVKFVTSIKSSADLLDSTVIFIPKHPTFYNYKNILDGIDYPYTFMYTAFFTLLNSFLQIVSCTLVAYGLARFNFIINKFISFSIILTLLIPPQVILLPLYFEFKYGIKGVDFTGTIIPFILLSITAMGFRNGLYIYILRQYYKNIPYILEEAACIDGCGPFKTFYKIMLPGALPMLITVFLFSFVWQWNDVYYSQVLAPNLDLMTIKLYSLKFLSLGSFSDIYNAMLETPKFFLLVTPLIFIYMFTQRFFTESIERSGTVG